MMGGYGRNGCRNNVFFFEKREEKNSVIHALPIGKSLFFPKIADVTRRVDAASLKNLKYLLVISTKEEPK